MKAAMVTLAIYNGHNPQDVLRIVFDGFPTTAEVAAELGEPKFQGLLDTCEVEELRDYPIEDGDAVQFSCFEGDKFMGSITVEEVQIAQTSVPFEE